MANNVSRGGLRWQPMALRPVFYEQLGEFFTSLRAKKRWGERETVSIAKRKGLPAFSRNILQRLERGAVKNIEPETLRSVAKLYEISYEDVLNRFLRARYGVMTTFGAEGQRADEGMEIATSAAAGETAHGGEHYDSAASRVLNELHDRHDATLEDIRAHASAILTAISRERHQRSPGQGSTPGKSLPRRRRDRGITH